MNSVKQHYQIDLSSNNNFVQVPAVQGDGNNTRYVEIELIENGVPYVLNPDEVYVTIAGTKPDNNEIWNPCQITDEGHILVQITYQMTATPGRSVYEIMIVEKAMNNQIKSFPFFLMVTPASFDPSYIISSNEFQALAEYTSAAEVAAEEAKAAAEDAEKYAGTFAEFWICGINDPHQKADQGTYGHLYYEKIERWHGSFQIVDGKNLQVTWDGT